jgi:catechol 2,3-dioxygenase-like lactoylglutathione lyase family enzyme
MSSPTPPTTIRIVPAVWMLKPLVVVWTAKRMIAPTAMRKIDDPMDIVPVYPDARRTTAASDELRAAVASVLVTRTHPEERRMTDPPTTTNITEVGTVFVPVADQDRALAFYVDQLGFKQRGDFVYGGGSRWVEVMPPGATNAIALVPPSEGQPADRDATHCALATTDVEADHAALRARGVDVDAEIAGTGTPRAGLISTSATIPDPVPRQFSFRDPDGNRFLVVQVG